ncbi:MAG: hypothetical protein V1686_00490 [Patescibacteria group bacterium]
MRRRFKKLLIIIISIVVILIIGAVILQITGTFAPQKIYGFSGTIIEINNNSIAVNAMIALKSGTTKNETKIVLINQDTKITELKIPTAINGQIPINVQPTETEIKISELKINDKIDITINPDNQKEFTAKTIKLIQ